MAAIFDGVSRVSGIAEDERVGFSNERDSSVGIVAEEDADRHD